MSALFRNIHQSNVSTYSCIKPPPPYSCLTLLKNACILTYDNSEFLFPPAINYGVTVKK